MKIKPFALERYFAKHEFTARYLLSSSDCEALSMSELLSMADSDTRRLWFELKFGYTESLGHPLLREAITDVYDDIEVEDILVCVPEEGIFLLMHALLEPGDHVICTFPGYQSLYEVARSIGCEVSTWKPDEGAGWRFDLDQLKKRIRSRTKMVVVNFPHNPTGYVPSKDEFEELIDFIRRQGVYLLSDEMYRFLEIEPGSTLSAACDSYDRAFSLSGLSKTFGLPGLRIGWIVSKDHEVLERMSLLKDYTTICSSAPSEILGIIALRSKDKIIELQLERVRKNNLVLESFINEYRDFFSWNRPKGGSICFPRMLTVPDTYFFCDELVKNTGIMLLPSIMFQYGNHHIRVGFGRANLPDVLSRFAVYLDQHFR
jgi:aspartate/methionine/tyrosine aminotransferase